MMLTALLAKKAGAPVRIRMDLEGDFCSAHYRTSPHYDKFIMGCKSDGTILGLDVHVTTDVGAYSSPKAYTGAGSAFDAGAYNGEACIYRIPSCTASYSGVFTNKFTESYVRGVGSPPALLALELHADRMAEKLGMDPVDFRLKNCLHTNDPAPVRPRLSVGVEECIIKGAAAIDWKSKWHEPGTKTLENGRKHGIGMAIASHGSGTPGAGQSARIEIFADGTATVYTGVQDTGQATREAMCLICAEELQYDPENIRVVIGDTHTCPWGPPSIASQVTAGAGRAVMEASEDLKERLFKFAAPILNVDKTALSTADGFVFETTNPNNKINFKDLITQTKAKSIIGVGTTVFTYNGTIGPYTASFAEVEVDTDTGKVFVPNFVVYVDCGRAINPMYVEGQFGGGTQMGLGYALYEGPVVDSLTGRILNPNMIDYKMFTSMEMPELTLGLVETIDPIGPYGAKGILKWLTTVLAVHN